MATLVTRCLHLGSSLPEWREPYPKRSAEQHSYQNALAWPDGFEIRYLGIHGLGRARLQVFGCAGSALVARDIYTRSMSRRMGIEQDLSAIWEYMVCAGQIRNRFAGANGEEIESGIRMTAAGPQQYALHVETGQDIQAGVVERSLGRYDLTIQWNVYRALKPQFQKPELDTEEKRQQRVYAPEVDKCLFACQDASHPLSLLQRHSPFRTTLKNFQWAALPNAVPVEQNGHFLWVPVTTNAAVTGFPHWLQVLTLPLLEDFLWLAAVSSNSMTYFNSLYAGASVNHIHFQSVQREREMPIEKGALYARRGRSFLEDYPASGVVYSRDTPVEQIWRDIDKLQACGVPFNLLQSGGRTYLAPRNIQNEMVAEFPGAILAAMEIAGKAITTEEAYYQRVDWAMLQAALHKSTLRNEELLRILES
jgi:hypothetical protein